VLVIVGVVLMLGVLAVTQLGRSSGEHAERAADCIKTFSRGAGAGGSGGGDVSSLAGKAGADTPTASKGVWGTTADVAKGFFVDGLWGTVKGIGTAIANPIDTVSGIASAVAHPIDTASAIKQAVVTAWDENPERLVGAGIFEVLTLPVAAAKGAKVAKAAEKLDDAADAAKSADRVADASKVTKADDCVGGVCMGGSCFGAGTPVATPDGDRPIETIAPGDLVMARDPETGLTEPRRVAHLIVTPDREVLDLALAHDDGTVETLVVTPEHPFFREGSGFVPAASLEAGDAIVTASGHVRVRSLATSAARITVYNFEVEVAHTYFVGKSAAWVHNTCAAQAAQERLNKMSPDQRKAAFEHAFEKVNGRRPTDADHRAAMSGGLDPKVKAQMLEDLAGSTPASGKVGLDRVAEQQRIDEIGQRGAATDAPAPSPGAPASALPQTGKTLGKGDVVNVESYDKVAGAIDGKVTVAGKRVSLDEIEARVEALRGGGTVPPVEVAPGNPPVIVSGYESYVASQMTGKPVEVKTVAAGPKGSVPSTIPVD